MDLFLENIRESIALLGTKIQSWIDTLVLSLPNVTLAILTFIFGIIIIAYKRKLIRKLANKSFPNNIGIAHLIINISIVVLYGLLVVIILSILGLKGTVTAVLTSAGVAGLAIGLALQDPLMNLFSGVLMNVKHGFKVGDFIETNGYIGEVREVSLKSTLIRMLSGEEVNVPNKIVIQNPVKNYSTNGSRRIDIECSVSYTEDLERVKRIVEQTIAPYALSDRERPVEFIYTDFAESSINFQLRFWTNTPTVWDYLNAKSVAIMSIKKAFDKEGIVIPFPIRTIDIPNENLRVLS